MKCMHFQLRKQKTPGFGSTTPAMCSQLRLSPSLSHAMTANKVSVEPDFLETRVCKGDHAKTLPINATLKWEGLGIAPLLVATMNETICISLACCVPIHSLRKMSPLLVLQVAALATPARAAYSTPSSAQGCNASVDEYDLNLHIVAVFVLLAASGFGVFFPVLLGERKRTSKAINEVFFVSRHW